MGTEMRTSQNMHGDTQEEVGKVTYIRIESEHRPPAFRRSAPKGGQPLPAEAVQSPPGAASRQAPCYRRRSFT
eukprot:15479344-Alexandrium_andersonii.AAC.1